MFIKKVIERSTKYRNRSRTMNQNRKHWLTSVTGQWSQRVLQRSFENTKNCGLVTRRVVFAIGWSTPLLFRTLNGSVQASPKDWRIDRQLIGSSGGDGYCLSMGEESITELFVCYSVVFLMGTNLAIPSTATDEPIGESWLRQQQCDHHSTSYKPRGWFHAYLPTRPTLTTNTQSQAINESNAPPILLKVSGGFRYSFDPKTDWVRKIGPLVFSSLFLSLGVVLGMIPDCFGRTICLSISLEGKPCFRHLHSQREEGERLGISDKNIEIGEPRVRIAGETDTMF